MGKIAQPGPYRLAEGERPTLAERRFLGYPDAYLGYVGYADFIGAEDTGECRPPKKGEWYLSGAVVEAYKATADYKGESFHIARLVRCVKCTYIKVTARIPGWDAGIPRSRCAGALPSYLRHTPTPAVMTWSASPAN